MRRMLRLVGLLGGTGEALMAFCDELMAN